MVLKKILKTISRAAIRTVCDKRLAENNLGLEPHILVVRWDNKLGDAIVSSFFYREAKKLNAKVTVLTTPELEPLYTKDFGVEHIIATSPNPSFGELRTIAKQLEQVDAVVHLVGRVQPSEILFLYLLQPVLIYSLDDALLCVNRKFNARTAGQSFALKYEAILGDLGLKSVNNEYVIPWPENPKRLVDVPEILFNPYASRPDKSISHEKSLELLCSVAKRYPQQNIGVLSNNSDRAKAEKLVEEINLSNVFALSDVDTPQDVAFLMSQVEVVISVDTAIVHLAVGLGKKLIAIYPYTKEPNPWLPPLCDNVAVVLSYHDTSRYDRTGVKNMNLFSSLEVMGALEPWIKFKKRELNVDLGTY
jgi:ADP-heptose:LPS heptosyltransferase